MQPVMLPKDELVARFGMTSRVAVRVGALLARGVGVSETVAEMLVDEEPLRSLVLDKDLLDGAETLTDETLAALQKRHNKNGFFDDTPLVIHEVKDGGGNAIRTLCLEEEMIAGSGPAATAATATETSSAAANPASPDAPQLPALLSGGRNLPALSADEEAVESLFPPAEVARLKLVLLTGTEPKEKIEAIRKMRLIPLHPDEKGALLLQALQDDSPDVRGEAAGALTSLGLSERIASTVALLCTGDEPEREAALRSLRLQIDKAGSSREGEVAVVFAVLLGTLRSGGASLSLIKAVLGALQAIAPPLVIHEGPARELDRQLSRLLVTRYADLQGEIHQIYRACGESAVIRELVRSGFEEAATVESRAFYLGLLSEIVPDERSLQACIDEMAERAARGNDLDPTTARLATALRRFGPIAVRALLTQIETADEDSKETILVLLSTIFYGTDLEEGIEDEIARRLIEVYGLSRPQVRIMILECPFLTHHDVQPETRERIARVILDDLHEFRLETTVEQVGSVLRRLGPVVLPMLREVATSSRYQVTRSQAVRTAGDIGYDFHALHYPGEGGDLLSPSAELVARKRAGLEGKGANGAVTDPPAPSEAAIQALRETLTALHGMLEDDETEDKATVLTAIGRIAWSGALDQQRLHDLCDYLTGEVNSSSWAYSIVDALGYLIAARELSRTDRAEIAHLLLGLLRAQMPERLSRMRESEDGDGMVHVLGHETTAYTELLPRVLQGLMRLVLTPQADKEVRVRALDNLLEVWEELVEFRLVWGPQNVTDIARILGRVGLSPYVEPHQVSAILEALMKRSESLTVLRVLGELVEANPQSTRMADLARQLFEKLQESLLEDESLEYDERRLILETMCRISTRELIGANREAADEIRSLVVGYTFDAIRDGMVMLGRAVWRVAQQEWTKAELADEIRRRLERFRLLPADA